LSEEAEELQTGVADFYGGEDVETVEKRVLEIIGRC
jgi:hypothetical protein